MNDKLENDVIQLWKALYFDLAIRKIKRLIAHKCMVTTAELPKVLRLIEKSKDEKNIKCLNRIINTIVYSSGFEKNIASEYNGFLTEV